MLQYVELGLFLVAVVLAYLSWRTANNSLKESTRTRRDMFLPIVISIEDISMLPEGWISFRNCGHGAAFSVEASLTGVNKKFFWRMMRVEAEPIWRIGLQGADLTKKTIADAQLVISYTDVFGRKIVSRYGIVQKLKDTGEYQPHINLDSFELELLGAK